MLKLMYGQKALGEKLLVECPQNDCLIYRNTYAMYKEIIADRELVAAMVNPVTLRAIDRDIRRLQAELDDLYFNNYAVKLAKG